MRDKTHDEFVIKWAKYIVNNPKKWNSKHTKFINSQFEMHKEFLQKLKVTAGGRKKIIELYDIKNLDGYKLLLS